MSISLKKLMKVRCRLIDSRTGQPAAGIVVSLSLGVDGATKSIPISTLSSDATGYLSFDLKPLVDLGIDVVSGLYVSAPQVALENFDLLGERITPERTDVTVAATASTRLSVASQERKQLCIEFPILVDRPKTNEESGQATCQSVNLPSVQRPDLCDYKLSPHSFVSPVKINLGGDCCESLTPSTVPVQEHNFYRVIVRAKRNGNSHTVNTSIERAVDITADLPQARPELRFAEVLDYQQRWFAIGHALGEIKYSLPLAPGETTQLAVIEWSRTDAASRFDGITANENLTHWQNRDRTIEETINAGLKETQGGWSWAGGLSSGLAYDAKAYGQYTGNWAAGGGTSNSSGTRDLAAESQQELHDSINQSTSYTRSLNSTVIVQGSQAEANNVRTRRVANHNHCHALTIQYYEVLRHFKLETTFVGRRSAVLIPVANFSFDRAKAIRFRYALEQALIDRTLLSYFDALVRLDLDLYETVATTTESKYFVGSLSGLNVDAANFPMFPTSNQKRLLIEKGSTLHITAKQVGNTINFGGGSAGNTDVDGQPGRPAPANQNWPLPDAPSFAFLAKVGPKFYLVQRDSTFEAEDEGELSLWFNDAGPLTDNNGSATATVSVTAPATAEPIDTEKVPVNSLSPKDADKMREAFLLRHLNANAVYYDRAVWVLMDAAERRLYLEAALGSNSAILAAMDDKPIAVSGNHVAFVYEGPLPFTPTTGIEVDPLESIVTLPTRGLFAEAQLGHCNSCEKRDVTRLWDWTEMTTEVPPEITGIEPGPRGQMPTVTPTPLPSNVIQIAPTPAAPDPAGLAAALRLLGTPDIFRDMSGLDEASMILGRLVDGTTTTLTEMVRGAAAAKQKIDGARAQQNATSAGQSSQKQTPTERYDNLQVAKEVAQAADQLGLSEQQKSELAQNILGGGGSGVGGGGGGGVFGQWLANTAAGAVPGAPKVAAVTQTDPGWRACCALGQWLVGLSGAVDPLTISGHRKGGLSPGGTTGYVYSKQIGLVDLGHVRDLADLTKFIYDALDRGAVTFNLFEGTASVFRTPPDQESRLAVAGAIAYVDSWAHEIATWPDRSSFSPEDLCSNIVGIECATRAIRVGGSFDAAMDSILYALLNRELDAATRIETSGVLTKIDGDWFDITKHPAILLRRNFDGVPWMASMAFDAPGAPLTPAWLAPSIFVPFYSEFSYMMNNLVAGKIVMLADMETTTDSLRATFVAANPGKDRP